VTDRASSYPKSQYRDPTGNGTGTGATGAAGDEVDTAWANGTFKDPAEADSPGGFVAPPPEAEDSFGAGGGDPTPQNDEAWRSAQTPVARAESGGTGTPVAGRDDPGGGGLGGVDFEMILSDLEKSEELTLCQAFATFDENGTGGIPMDHHGLRDYLVENSALTFDDLDLELIKETSKTETFELSLEGFVSIMRDQACSESEAIQSFMGLSGGEDQIPAPDCRTGLQVFGSEKLAGGQLLDELTWERVLDSLMWNADTPMVSLENWITYTKRLARTLFLFRVTSRNQAG